MCSDRKATISAGTSSLDLEFGTIKENLDDAEKEVEAARG